MTAARRYRTMVTDSARWEGFRFRPGDIVISTPIKCGTTWMQYLCALLIFDTADFGRQLTEISPWLDMVLRDLDATSATLAAQEHRRFIKTHTPLDGLPFDEQVAYITIGRDPRDVSLSAHNHFTNLRPQAREHVAAVNGFDPSDLPQPPDDPLERFWQWLDADLVDDSTTDAGTTLANLVVHLQTFWDRRDEPQIGLFHYDDLQADLPAQMRRLADLLSIERSPERIEQLAATATFDNMQNRADHLAPDVDADLWISNRAFFHSGTSGQWHDLLDAAAVARYERRLAELSSPDLADWLHRGWSGR